MYTNDTLYQDCSQKKAKGQSEVSAAEYAEGWNAYAAYLKATLEQRRGLSLGNFCKVGWQVKNVGKVTYRPVFHLTEQFCRSCMTPEAVRRHFQSSGAMGGDLSPFEDFNFSKAAIKFSNQMTKDQMFSAMRTLVQRLAEVVGDGREVELTFGDVGKLNIRGGDPRFSFSQEVISMEGVEAPAVVQDVGQRSAPAFTKSAPKGASDLDIRGNVPQMAAPGYTQPVPQAAYPTSPQYLGAVPEEEDYYEAPSRRLLSGSASQATFSDRGMTPNLTNSQYKKEMAYKEAMDRHIAMMEAKAAEVMGEKEQWKGHVEECLTQEREEAEKVKKKNMMNLSYIQHQMNMGEDRRKEQRKDDIIAASMHDYPKFKESAIDDMEEFVKGQKARVKADLDEQVRTNNTLRNLQKQRERTLEVNQLEANRQEMAMLRNAERAKKAYDKEALATAWNSDIRMKNIWKAIENHGKVGGPGSQAGSSHAPEVLSMDLPPPSRGGLQSAGRLMTGSSRRVPLGASSSLGKLQARLNTPSVR